MATLDFLILFAFILYALWSGFRSKAQASKNLEEYFLAGRSLKGWQAGLSMAATQFASDTPLLVTGLIATAGIFALWQLWIYALAFLLLGFVLAPCWRRAKVLTDAELTELRYGSKPAAVLRGVKAIYFGTIFNCTVLAWVFFAAAKIAEPFLLWNLWLPENVFGLFVSMVSSIGVPLTIASDPNLPEVWIKSANNFISIMAIVLVAFAYSATGGLRAVIKTDIMQIVIMFAGTAIFAGYVIYEVGGLAIMGDLIRERFAAGGPGGIRPNEILAFTPSNARDASMALLAVFAVQWLIQLNSDGTGYLAQRSMACRSDKDARQAAVVFTFTQIFLRTLLWLPIGVGLLLLFPPDPALPTGLLTAEREATYVRGMQELLPVGVLGLMLTAMLAALASTVDTHLNWGSSYWTNDIYKRFVCQYLLQREPSPRSLVWVARGANLLILSIALMIGTQLTSIQNAWQISLLLGAGAGIVLLIRWFWWRMNAWGEITAIVASMVLAPLVYFNVESQAARLLLVATGATLAALAAVYYFGPEDKAKLKIFYRRVRPPGFWGPITETMNESDIAIGRLWKGLAATFICSFSLFCLLVSIGSWMLGAPKPTWFPGAELLWYVLVFVVGLLLTPVWVRLGFDEFSKDPQTGP